MAARAVQAITASEFATMLQAVRPPSGWSKTRTLAVANSGGPDSTALLFLLSRHIQNQPAETSTRDSPKELLSLTIDHNLQPNSSDMAQRAANTAEALGIKHITTKLPWGEDGHPPKPEDDQAIEELARNMRYDSFFNTMIKERANGLALGHHLDDQVETMLLRLGRGSTFLGLAGMRPCRRWGMGEKRWEPGMDGRMIEGMRKWIVRPLLTVEKDRILATCEENKLDYVNDPTNFQPAVTTRNAIRHVLNNGGTSATSAKEIDFPEFAIKTRAELANINKAAARQPDVNFNLSTDLPTLRQISKDLSAKILDIDKEVDEFIEAQRRKSVEGTFMFAPQGIDQVENPLVLQALVYRIARYVSPEPWGSARAELGRRKTSVERLVKHLKDWSVNFRTVNKSMIVGSHIWWRLVEIRRTQPKTTLKTTTPRNLNWLVSRQPRHRLEEPLDGQPPTEPHPLKRDVTDEIKKGLEALNAGEGPPLLELLYDCRFLLKFQLDKIPAEIQYLLGKGSLIKLKPRSEWDYPQVVITERKKERPIQWNMKKSRWSLDKEWGLKMKRNIDSGWITMEYFRPTSAV